MTRNFTRQELVDYLNYKEPARDHKNYSMEQLIDMYNLRKCNKCNSADGVIVKRYNMFTYTCTFCGNKFPITKPNI